MVEAAPAAAGPPSEPPARGARRPRAKTRWGPDPEDDPATPAAADRETACARADASLPGTEGKHGVPEQTLPIRKRPKRRRWVDDDNKLDNDSEPSAAQTADQVPDAQQAAGDAQRSNNELAPLSGQAGGAPPAETAAPPPQQPAPLPPAPAPVPPVRSEIELQPAAYPDVDFFALFLGGDSILRRMEAKSGAELQMRKKLASGQDAGPCTQAAMLSAGEVLYVAVTAASTTAGDRAAFLVRKLLSLEAEKVRSQRELKQQAAANGHSGSMELQPGAAEMLPPQAYHGDIKDIVRELVGERFAERAGPGAPLGAPALSSEADPANLYVGSIAASVTQPALRALFETAGPVADCRLMLDRNSASGAHRGFAFVRMAHAAAAEAAIASLHGYLLQGRRLAVRVKGQPPAYAAPPRAPQLPPVVPPPHSPSSAGLPASAPAHPDAARFYDASAAQYSAPYAAYAYGPYPGMAALPVAAGPPQAEPQPVAEAAPRDEAPPGVEDVAGAPGEEPPGMQLAPIEASPVAVGLLPGAAAPPWAASVEGTSAAPLPDMPEAPRPAAAQPTVPPAPAMLAPPSIPPHHAAHAYGHAHAFGEAVAAYAPQPEPMPEALPGAVEEPGVPGMEEAEEEPGPPGSEEPGAAPSVAEGSTATAATEGAFAAAAPGQEYLYSYPYTQEGYAEAYAAYYAQYGEAYAAYAQQYAQVGAEAWGGAEAAGPAVPGAEVASVEAAPVEMPPAAPSPAPSKPSPVVVQVKLPKSFRERQRAKLEEREAARAAAKGAGAAGPKPIPPKPTLRSPSPVPLSPPSPASPARPQPRSPPPRAAEPEPAEPDDVPLRGKHVRRSKRSAAPWPTEPLEAEDREVAWDAPSRGKKAKESRKRKDKERDRARARPPPSRSVSPLATVEPPPSPPRKRKRREKRLPPSPSPVRHASPAPARSPTPLPPRSPPEEGEIEEGEILGEVVGPLPSAISPSPAAPPPKPAAFVSPLSSLRSSGGRRAPQPAPAYSPSPSPRVAGRAWQPSVRATPAAKGARDRDGGWAEETPSVGWKQEGNAAWGSRDGGGPGRAWNRNRRIPMPPTRGRGAQRSAPAVRHAPMRSERYQGYGEGFEANGEDGYQGSYGGEGYEEGYDDEYGGYDDDMGYQEPWMTGRPTNRPAYGAVPHTAPYAFPVIGGGGFRGRGGRAMMRTRSSRGRW